MNDDAVSSYTSSLERGSSPPLTKLESYSENESIVQPGTLVYTLPTQLEGELEWGKAIAYGGYSVVHRGKWIRPGGGAVPVAIKRIRRVYLGSEEDEDENDRFERRIKREVVVWQAAKHANILEFYGFKIDEDGPLFVSPLCENGNLGQYTRINTKLTDAEKLKLLHDAAQGLAHLHLLERPIIHGDVKPENIMITNEIKGVLCDFGISMVITGLGIRTGLTSEGQGSGSPGFRAVELLRGLSPTLWCDVYAFGGVILATMSGQRPFHQLQKNPRAIDHAVYEGKTPIPFDHPGLPEADTLWQLLKDCWSAEPHQRPRMNTVGDLLLKEIQRRSTISSPVSSLQWASGAPSSTSSPPSPIPPPEGSIVQPGIPIYDIPSLLEGTLGTSLPSPALPPEKSIIRPGITWSVDG